VHANKAGSLPADTKNAEVISPGSVAALFSCGGVVNEFTVEVLSLMVQIGQYFGEPITGKMTVITPFLPHSGLWPDYFSILHHVCTVEVYALTSRVTTFDDDLTPVVEEKETPDSVDEVTTTTLQRHNDEHMDVHRSSSDSDPESRRHQGTGHRSSKIFVIQIKQSQQSQTNRVPMCCKQRWTLTVINWRRSSVELSWQHLRRSTYRGEKSEDSANFRVRYNVPVGGILVTEGTRIPLQCRG